MKRYLLLFLVLGFVFASDFLINSAAVRAEDSSSPMTEGHIARIRSSCVEAQSTLTQLHATDALLRVNRGQLYESISAKLMTPFNNRVTSNRLDGVLLASVTADYDRQLTDFRTSYQQYEEAMSRTLKIDCINQPVAFYDSVTETRSKRQGVHDNVVVLQKTIQTYKDEFESFAARFQGGAR